MIVRVALPVPLRQAFDYECPSELEAGLVHGSWVRVPFGNRKLEGVVIARDVAAETDRALKPIDAVLGDPPVDPDRLQLIEWVASYYRSPIGEVVTAAIPRAVRSGHRQVRFARVTTPFFGDTRSGWQRRRQLYASLVARGGRAAVEDLLRATGVSASALSTLTKRGVIEIRKEPDDRFVRDFSERGRLERPTWSDPQRHAIEDIGERIGSPSYSTVLLHGVTGSGKTEVYVSAVERALEKGLGALVLLPEIALTPQTVARFEARLGRVAVLHSMLSPGDRAREFEALRRGVQRVAIGARSVVFAPVENLGLVIVDEEHEQTYKQESSPRYHARDVAVYRASKTNAVCVLGSATPSLETWQNAEQGRYTKLDLPDRVTRQSLPTMEIIDRRIEPYVEGKGRPIISPRLGELIEQTLSRSEQVLLFLNRRGFARHVSCASCGHVVSCGDCDVSLVLHKGEGRLRCHYCGVQRDVPARCPACESPNVIRKTAGTERIEDHVQARFPGATVGRLDRDTATSESRLADIIEKFRRGETQILVGTQMVAKGHDIPGVTLVGVLDADVALSRPDFRAAERAAQLLCQVAGRAGRGDRPGRVVIQTTQPGHYAIEAARLQDPTVVYNEELPVRKSLRYPPFSRWARILIEDEDPARARGIAQDIADVLRHRPEAGDVEVVGPAPAPLTRLRGRFRHHVFLRAPLRVDLEKPLVALDATRFSRSTRVTVDIDPQQLS